MLGWLLFVRTPATDKQLISLIDSRDALVRELTERHNATLKDLTDKFQAAITERSLKLADIDKERRHDYRDSLNTVALHCERELEMTTNAIRSNLDEQRALMVDIRRIIEELRRSNPAGSGPLPPVAPNRAPRGNVSDPDAKKG